MPDPEGPTMATSSPSSTRRSTPAEGDDGRVGGVLLYHLDELEDRRLGGGLSDREQGRHRHDAGTWTSVPALMPGPLIWTSVLS